MNDQMLQLIGLAVLGAAVAGRWIYRTFWCGDARARRRLAAGSKVVSDRALVTVTGRVRALTTIEAPLSGTACVAFVAWAEVGSSDAAGRRNAQLSSTQMVPFELLTRDGTVIVEAATAEIALDPRPLIPRQLEREARWLAERGRDASRIRLWSFRQITLEQGDSISVQGFARVEDGQPVRLVHHDDHAMIIGPARE